MELKILIEEADRFYKLGLLSDAEGKYRKIIEKYPDYYEAWLKMGNIFIRTDQLDAAVLAYETCTAQAPEDVRCWNNLALARVKQGVHTLDNGKSKVLVGTQAYMDLDEFQVKLIKILSSE
ncbi:hypothetical protein GCM10007877_00950 [Marinibactrum halimedae]|uniref:Tetratricopeptide repeat protein n=2 Tax=Marinibactrum halimedae TaxID=1444977 RepID=A0AA37T1K9_9GAMM|nr:hypothetical protein GCM10007877_00950 [Marinibactrum halimedae]